MPTTKAKQQGPKDEAPERRTEKKGRTAKIGNLCRDPELAFSAAGQAYARVRIAVEEPLVAGDWSGERATSFYDVTVFGQMAENFAQSCQKGCRVIVMGRAELEHWTDNEGKEQVSKKILADGIGPDLRWSLAEVTKVARAGSAGEVTPPPKYDEEPF